MFFGISESFQSIEYLAPIEVESAKSRWLAFFTAAKRPTEAPAAV